jgi:hypothetical protein
MIDNITINDLAVDREYITTHPELDWPQEKVNRSTGDCYETDLNKINLFSKRYRTTLQFANIKPVNPNRFSRITLNGSLHKYFNNDPSIGNSNQFTIRQVISTIDDIIIKFQINPDISLLNSLEYGLNLEIENPKTFLDGLISHKGVFFVKVIRHDRYSAEVEHKDYKIKIYWKSLQYHQPGNIVRIEVKAMASHSSIRNATIRTIADLKDPEKLQLLKNDLVTKFQSILWYDIEKLQKEKLSETNKTFLAEGRLKDFWDNLVEHEKGKSEKEYQFILKRKQNERRKEYKKLMVKFSGRNLILITAKKIEENLANLFVEKTDDDKMIVSQFGYLYKYPIRGEDEKDCTTSTTHESTPIWGIDTYNHLRQPDKYDHTGMVIYRQWQGHDPKHWLLDPVKFPFMTNYNLEVLTEDLQINHGVTIPKADYLKIFRRLAG